MKQSLRFVALSLGLGVLGTTAEAQRTVKLPGRPTPEAPRSFKYPTYTIDTLPNGLRYVVVENHEMPIVNVRTTFEGAGPYGLWFLDPEGKEGAWGLLMSSLREGTTLRSGTQITDEIADLGSEFLTTNSIAFVPPWIRAPKSTWRPSLKLLSDLLINPTVPASEFSRVQANYASQMERLPSITLGNRIIYTALYGATSPYTRFATATSIRGVTRDDLLSLRRDYLGPQNTTIVIAGDVTRAEVRAAIQEAFADWQRSAKTVTPIVPPTPAPAPTTIYLKDAPGQTVAQVVAGQVVPGRDHADAAALAALASSLGDFSNSTGSRVYRAFRTERGLAYSPGVELLARPIPETVPLLGRMTVPDTVADVAVQTYLRVLRELKETKPITESELEFSKRNLIGRLPMDVERLDPISFNVTLAVRDRLPAMYLNDWTQRVSALTLADVQAASAKYLDPDHVGVVVVGDRSKIEARIRATGIPVVIVEK